MAKTTYLSIPAGQEDHYWSGLQSGDRFTIAKIRAKTALISTKKIVNITNRTYLYTCKELWAGFTPAEKQAWKDVDFHAKKHGWRTFVGDQCRRIKEGYTGTATPNQYHQDLVGYIYIEPPATEIKLIQPHPSAYWISRKVTGKKSMYEPVKIEEYLSFPHKIAISFKSNLVATGTGAFAKFYAKILHLYQGQNLYTYLEINIPLAATWQRIENIISYVIGQPISYNLYLHLYNVQGDLFFDNIVSEHNSQNWARDIFCKKIEQSFTRGFYQVPKNWAPITMPEGAIYLSVYGEEDLGPG